MTRLAILSPSTDSRRLTPLLVSAPLLYLLTVDVMRGNNNRNCVCCMQADGMQAADNELLAASEASRLHNSDNHLLHLGHSEYAEIEREYELHAFRTAAVGHDRQSGG